MNSIARNICMFLLVLCSCAGPGGNKPSREPYEGFEWKELSGAGLWLWAQSNEEIRLLADPSLPGIVMVRNGAAAPRPLIRVFDLPGKDINGLIPVLENTEGWDKSQTCRFSEVDSGRKGVRRYVLVPDGEYAAEITELMKSEPVPSTCSGWGVGNSGNRYFEVHESSPFKAIFMEIGQEAPLYDEGSVVFSEKEGRKEDELCTMSGTLRIGHEVRSFMPDGSDKEFWIVDRTGTLVEMYDQLTQGVKNGEAVSAELRLEYNGKWDDGFAADYDGVYLVREVQTLSAVPTISGAR